MELKKFESLNYEEIYQKWFDKCEKLTTEEVCTLFGLVEAYRMRLGRLAEAENLLSEAHDLLDDIHGYNSDVYHAISKYFNGDDGEDE